MNYSTVTHRAIVQPTLNGWTERRFFAFSDANARCKEAVRSVLGVEPPSFEPPLSSFSFDGQSGYYSHLMFRIEGLTFEFEWSYVTLRYHEDRLRLVEVHEIQGFHHVIYGINELGHILSELPKKHPATPKIEQLNRMPLTETPYDLGAWSWNKSQWNS